MSKIKKKINCWLKKRKCKRVTHYTERLALWKFHRGKVLLWAMPGSFCVSYVDFSASPPGIYYDYYDANDPEKVHSKTYVRYCHEIFNKVLVGEIKDEVSPQMLVSFYKVNQHKVNSMINNVDMIEKQSLEKEDRRLSEVYYVRVKPNLIKHFKVVK